MWKREILGLAVSGLLGWTVLAWLCVYFWNHDVGIGGGPMLLFGPPLVMFGSLALFHLLCAIRDRALWQPGPRLGRVKLRAGGLMVLIATCPFALWAWARWLKTVSKSFGRYVPQSHIEVPGNLYALAWLLTLLAVAAVIYVARDPATNASQ